MFKKLSTLAIAGGILASLFGFAGSAAAAAPGSDPNTASAPMGQWMPISVGQQVWFAFNYAGDGSQILARMNVVPTTAAGFEIWTPTQFQQYVQGSTVTPIGRGATNTLFGGDQVWTGNFNEAGTYYAIVSQTGSDAGNFALSVTGSGVSYLPAPAAKPAAPATKPAVPATKPAAAATKPAAAAAGSTPNNPAPIDQWESLTVGQQRWYSFQYPGDKSQITLAMVVDPAGTAGFQVLTPAQFQQYLQDGTITAVGQGSVDNSINADLVWSGNFDIPGTYYVLVSQTGSTPSNYMLAFH
jgi:hypothetical protein